MAESYRNSPNRTLLQVIHSEGVRGFGEAQAAAPFPCTPNPRRTSSASLRTISLDDSEHLLHNHHVSVAALRLLFTFAPECGSPSHRNWRSPSPEYPVGSRSCAHAGQYLAPLTRGYPMSSPFVRTSVHTSCKVRSPGAYMTWEQRSGRCSTARCPPRVWVYCGLLRLSRCPVGVSKVSSSMR